MTPKCITAVKMDRPVSQQESWRIPKMDGPSPGSYDMIAAYDRTQRRKTRSIGASKSRRVDFTEAYAKLFKSNPPQG